MLLTVVAPFPLQMPLAVFMEAGGQWQATRHQFGTHPTLFVAVRIGWCV